MKNIKGIVSVSPQHIEAGITKYKGIEDEELSKLIQFANLNYTPYRFNDGRILLVLPNKVGAFLYANKEVLFETLNLEQLT